MTNRDITKISTNSSSRVIRNMGWTCQENQRKQTSVNKRLTLQIQQWSRFESRRNKNSIAIESTVYSIADQYKMWTLSRRTIRPSRNVVFTLPELESLGTWNKEHILIFCMSFKKKNISACLSGTQMGLTKAKKLEVENLVTLPL